MYKLTGTIKVINDTVKISEKFSKREFVVTDNDAMYPQDISLQLIQDKVSILDNYSEGESVEVSFNLNGREWTSPQGEVKYFNTLNAWRIEKAESSQQKNEPQQNTDASSEQDDLLPF
jgi:hypothetical protein